MDLNYILFRHQLLLVAAADPAARPDERGRAAARADRISSAVEAWRSERQASTALEMRSARAAARPRSSGRAAGSAAATRSSWCLKRM